MSSITQQELDRGWYFQVVKKDGTPSGWIMTTLNGLTAWGDCKKMKAAYPNGVNCSPPTWALDFKKYNPEEFRSWLSTSGLPLSQKLSIYSGAVLLGVGVLALAGVATALLIAKKKKVLMFKAPDAWSQLSDTDELGNPVDKKTAYIEAILANDEASTDEELIEHFQNNGLTTAEAKEWVAKRQEYMLMLHSPKGKKSLAILTPEQQKHWDTAMEYYIEEEGMSDAQADKQAWRDLQLDFPELKKFDGIDDKGTMAALKKGGYYESPNYDEIGSFYVVTKATPDSTIDDVLFEADVPRMMLQSLGGLREDDIVGIYKNGTEAKKAAMFQMSKPVPPPPPDFYQESGDARYPTDTEAPADWEGDDGALDYGSPQSDAFTAKVNETKANLKKLAESAKGVDAPAGFGAYWNKTWPKTKKVAHAVIDAAKWSQALNPFTAIGGIPLLIASKKVKRINDMESAAVDKGGDIAEAVVGKMSTVCSAYLANGSDINKTILAIQSDTYGAPVEGFPRFTIDYGAINEDKFITASLLILDTIAGYGAAGGGAAAASTGVGAPAAAVGGGVAAVAQADDMLAVKLLIDSLKGAVDVSGKTTIG